MKVTDSNLFKLSKISHFIPNRPHWCNLLSELSFSTIIVISKEI